MLIVMQIMNKTLITIITLSLLPYISYGSKNDKFCYFKERPGVEREFFSYTGYIKKENKEKVSPKKYWKLTSIKEMNINGKNIKSIELWYDNAFKNMYFKPFLKSFNYSSSVDVCGSIKTFKNKHYLQIHEIKLHNKAIKPLAMLVGTPKSGAPYLSRYVAKPNN